MKTWLQFVRFVFVGAMALGVNLAVTTVGTEFLHIWYFHAFLVGVLCSWTFVFFANTRITFSDSPRDRYSVRYAVFFGVYVAAFAVNAGLVYSLTSHWGLYYPVSIVFATAVTTLITFTLSKRYVYGHASMRDARVVRLARAHWVALLVAVCVGLTTVAPFIAFHSDPVYRGVEMIGSDAEEHYVARMQEVYDGYPGLGNTFMPKKIQPYGPAGLGEIVVASIGKTLGLSSVSVNVFAKFLFPFLVVLLIYALLYSMVRHQVAAILGGVAPVLGYNLVSSVQSWIAGLTGTTIDSMFLIFARPINPEVSSINLFGAMFLLYRGFHNGRRPKWYEVVGAGVLAGSALYISPYVFAFLGSLLLVSFVWCMYKDRSLALPAFVSGIVALVCTIPFAINYLHLRADIGYVQFAERTGVATNYLGVLPRWLILMTLLVLFVWPKSYPTARTYLFLVFAALFLVIEQNVLTGIYLFPGHIHWYITKPLAAILLGVYIGFLVRLLHSYGYLRIGRLIAVVAMVGLFYNAALWQIQSYVGSYHLARTAQSYAPVFEYLNRQPQTQVVWADTTLSLYVPMYTKHDTPNNSYAIYYLNPPHFYTSSLFLDYRLQGVTPDRALTRFVTDREWVNVRLNGMYGREISGHADPISDETLKRLSDEYTAFYARPLGEVLRELEVTMLVAKRGDRARYDAEPALTEAYIAEDFVVYTTKI